jgi:hypothetical protein
VKRSEPPALATWLLTRLVPGENTESMIGDLIEQHQRGRSFGWYWRQTITAIVTGFAAEMWHHKWLAISVVALSAYLPDLYTFSRVWVLIGRFDRLWYPHLINSTWSWIVINPWAYRLQPYWLTSRIVLCAIVAALSSIMVRLYPRQRGLVVTLFLVPQVGLRIPYVWTGLTDWLREPDNPIWFFGYLWFLAFWFIAVPLSILLGARWGAPQNNKERS